ncbi:MAG: anti-sigma factor [Microgenomates group bacterium]
MKTRDIVLGLIVLVALIGIVLWVRKVRIDKALKLSVTTPTIEEKVNKTFNFSIPDDVEKKELKDVSGGNGFGIATKDMVLADLPDLDSGQIYQVWVEKDGKVVSLGKMRVAKGGWIFEGSIPTGYQKVVVSQEKSFDGKIETRVLEGSL